MAALNPLWGLDYLLRGGITGFLVLGGVFLCVTGAEALYADMGHFGVGPIRLSWWAVVFPALILNYAGQAAIVIAGAPTEGNIFYRLCPAPLLTPMILLATVATVIASQSIITGAYSMTRQAILLGWLPRMTITQTSEEGYGQIYVGAVNWLLMIVTLTLTIGFGKSDNLAAAYGIAVSATMLMTSVLLFIAMREIWKWPVWAAGAVAACFAVIDGELPRREPRQAPRRRLGSPAARLPRLRRDVDLAPRRDGGAGPGRGGAHAALRDGRTPEVRKDRARAGVRGVPDPGQGQDPAGHGLARAPEPRAARGRAGADHHDALGPLDGARGTGDGGARGRPLLARGGAHRLHGASRRPGHSRRVQEAGRGDRPRRRDLLHRRRDRGPAPRTARGCRAGRRPCSPR